MFDPEKDGIDHINVYSKGRTELGRLLSNFADTPFIHPVCGDFRTVEGFWYWTISGNEEFRTLPGWKCKEIGKNCIPYRTHPTKEELGGAYLSKLSAHPNIAKMLKENTLPLTHYYVYNGRVVEPKEWGWTAQLWVEIMMERI